VTLTPIRSSAASVTLQYSAFLLRRSQVFTTRMFFCRKDTINAALGDLAVIVRGRDLPVRCDPSFFILPAGRSRIAYDRINHLSCDRAALKVEPR
jgi:hypothetical protein